MSRGAKAAVLVALAAVALVLVAVLPGSGHPSSSSGATTTAVAPPATTRSTPTTVPDPVTTATTAAVRPTPTTSPATPATPATTVDPGSLPQTNALPVSTDPALRARLATLWKAVTTGQSALGLPAFFPLGAYVQVKAIADPERDYNTRLIADYDQDLQSLRDRLGPSAATAVLTGVTVPSTAQWIVPGVEYNKGSYWRVYGAVVSYTSGGQAGSFSIASMISWRGQWYVVHLLSIR